ncbi:MAG: MEKHLA domain-containing protein [Leptolyngbyaceae cyanobacterium bins.349]|nr:MEKHLA domain-containing protein [Leptolyngbyaceae cyanobacterium bins.349]
MIDPVLPWQQAVIVRHTQRLLRSFQHWTGTALLDPTGSPEILAQQLFEAPFVVVSHGTQPDPILNYGNQTALNLWEMDWHHFTQTPSRLTAEPMEQADRDRLLQRARETGFIDDYEGIRISRTGRRFRIRNVILWDVLDETETRCGQAAMFSQWERV